MNQPNDLQVLLHICARHRSRYGIREPTRQNDCEFLACKTGCPIKGMPDALTDKDLNSIAREVAKEHRLQKITEESG